LIAYLKNTTTEEDLKVIETTFKKLGLSAYYLKSLKLFVITKINLSQLEPTFKEKYFSKIIDINTAYQLSSKQYKEETFFEVNGNLIGTNYFNMVAGPCSVENEDQIFETAALLHKLGIKFIRGGAFKPRTSPYSFKGLGKEGLVILKKAAVKYNLSVVTELLDLSLLDDVYEYADIIQVGSRNMSNFYMLTQLGKIDKPVLLKRGMQAKVTEWLLAADYILSGGNEKVILCERGIRSFDTELRNVMDIAAIAMIKNLSHLPIWADPSHGTGLSGMVTPLAKASVIVGANGLMIEIHPTPTTALSDANQALSFEQTTALVSEINVLQKIVSDKNKINYLAVI